MDASLNTIITGLYLTFSNTFGNIPDLHIGV